MATKAKTVAVKDKEKEAKAAETPEKDSADAPSPLLAVNSSPRSGSLRHSMRRALLHRRFGSSGCSAPRSMPCGALRSFFSDSLWGECLPYGPFFRA